MTEPATLPLKATTLKSFSIALWIAAYALAMPMSHAQERAAGASMENQMSWTALSTQIKTVDSKTSALNTRMDQAVFCGRLGKVYAPGAGDADGNGCKAASVDLSSIINTMNAMQALLNNIAACGDAGKTFNRGTNSCEGSQQMFTKVTSYGTGNYGSKTSVNTGYHSLCMLGYSNKGGNFWLRVIDGPNANGKFRWNAEVTTSNIEPIVLCYD